MRLLFVVSFLFLYSCTSRIPNNTLLKDICDVNEIDSVEMHNIREPHWINKNKIKDFSERLGKSKYQNNLAIKTGSTCFSFYIKGKEYFVSGTTKGKYFELYRKNEENESPLTFEMEDFNLNNY